MAIHHGALEAYWEQGWEGRIEYALAIEGQSHPFFLTTGQHLTIYGEDGDVLWQGLLRFVSRGREQHHLPTGIWAFEKQRGVPFDQWLGWFLHDPPLRATVVAEPELSAMIGNATPTAAALRPLTLLGRGALLGAIAGAALASLYTVFGGFLTGLALLLSSAEASQLGEALLGLAAFGIGAGLFAVFVGILPATLIGALLGLLIGLVCLPVRGRLTGARGALIGLAVAAGAAVIANLLLAPDLLRAEEGTFGPVFIYLFWLGAPSLLALGGGAAVGWVLARQASRRQEKETGSN